MAYYAPSVCTRMLILLMLCGCGLMGRVRSFTMEELAALVEGPLSGQTSIKVPPYVLSGSIPPELGSLTNLTKLDLGQNYISGPIPPELGRLRNLRHLSLYRNYHLSGPIPAELGNLVNLEYLGLSYNDLSGPIPPELGTLNLQYLYLDCNNLSGPIPIEVLLMKGAKNFRGNRLTIPVELGDRVELTTLNLSSWGLLGPIPSSLGRLTKLTSLDLGQNMLSGPIPSSLGNLSQLASLALGNNQLSGPIPLSLSSLTKLTSLELGTNNLSSPIPPELGKLTLLTKLDLSRNSLSGSIPPELGSLINLKNLSLSSNTISGPILGTLTSLTNLTSLDLETNILSGPIPPALGNLTRLTVLGLGSNQLVGTIPKELSSLANLNYLSLNNNTLSGTIPSGFDNLKLLFYFYFDATDIQCDYVSWPLLAVQRLGLPCSPPAWVAQLNLRALRISFPNISMTALDLSRVPPAFCDRQSLLGPVRIYNCSGLRNIRFGPAFNGRNPAFVTGACGVSFDCALKGLSSDTRREICVNAIFLSQEGPSDSLCTNRGAKRVVITAYSIFGAAAVALCLAFGATACFKNARGPLLGEGVHVAHPLVSVGVYLFGIVGGVFGWVDLYTDVRIILDIWGARWLQWVILASILAPYGVSSLFLAESWVANNFSFARLLRGVGLSWVWPPPRMDTAAAQPWPALSPLRWAAVLVVWPLCVPAVVFLDIVAFVDKLGFHPKVGPHIYGMDLWYDSRSMVELFLRTVPQLGFQTAIFIIGNDRKTIPNVYIDETIFLPSIGLSLVTILSQLAYTLWKAMVASEYPFETLWRRIRCVGRSWVVRVPARAADKETRALQFDKL